MDIFTLFFNVTVVVICLLILAGLYVGVTQKNYKLMFGLIVLGIVLLALAFFMMSGIMS